MLAFNGVIQSITGDFGGAVFGAAGNINMTGIMGLTILGNPATSTITVSGAGVASQVNTDAGNIVPAAGIITIAGGTNIATAGAGSTVTINLDGTTDHAVQVGNVGGALTSLAVGATGETLMGVTGADPGWTNSPSFGGSVTAATSVTATLGDVVVTAGNLTLPTTTATVGQIVQNANRLLHTFGTNNLFLGIAAGNTTLTVLNAVVNLGIGLQTLSALTDGNWNLVVGHSSAQALTTGIQNTIVGTAALQIATSAGANTAIGMGTLSQLLTGTGNIAIGLTAGNALVAAESNNILIGHAGIAAESNTIRLGTVATHVAAYIAGNTTSSGSFTSTAGAITATLGNIVATAGDVNIGNIAAAITAPYVNFLKSRAAAVITSGDILGGITFNGHDSTGYKTGSQITSTSSGTIAAGRIASDLKFYTSPDAVSAPVQRFTIASTGAMTIATPDSGTALTVTAGGITVSAGDISAATGTVKGVTLATNPTTAHTEITGVALSTVGTDANISFGITTKGATGELTMDSLGGQSFRGVAAGFVITRWHTKQAAIQTVNATPAVPPALVVGNAIDALSLISTRSAVPIVVILLYPMAGLASPSI